MRRAAGIILIVLSVAMIVDMLLKMSGYPYSSFPSMIWWAVSHWIVWGGFLIAGGVFCLKRRYWGLCLVSALLTFLTWILRVLDKLVSGGLVLFDVTDWLTWILVIGALISTVLISLTKKEWKEFSNSMGRKVSNGD